MEIKYTGKEVNSDSKICGITKSFNIHFIKVLEVEENRVWLKKF